MATKIQISELEEIVERLKNLEEEVSSANALAAYAAVNATDIRDQLEKLTAAIADHEAPATAPPTFFYPMPILTYPRYRVQNLKPVVSDGYSPRKTDERRYHPAWDIMYRRPDSVAKWDGVESTKWFWVPSNKIPVTPMLAGKVHWACEDKHGYSVLIDHGDVTSWAKGVFNSLELRQEIEKEGDPLQHSGNWWKIGLTSYYTHMKRNLRGEKISILREGTPVDTDTVLGAVGDSPRSKRDPNHLHFGLRLYINAGEANYPVEPKYFEYKYHELEL